MSVVQYTPYHHHNLRHHQFKQCCCSLDYVNQVEAYETQSDDELADIEHRFKSVYLCQVTAPALYKQTL